MTQSPFCIVCKERPRLSRHSILCLICMGEVHQQFQAQIARSGPIGQVSPLKQAMLRALDNASRAKK